MLADNLQSFVGLSVAKSLYAARHLPFFVDQV